MLQGEIFVENSTSEQDPTLSLVPLIFQNLCGHVGWFRRCEIGDISGLLCRKFPLMLVL